MQEDEPDRLLRCSSLRPGDPGHRHRHVGTERLAGAGRHRGGGLGRDCAVPGQDLLGHAELGELDVVRVGDDRRHGRRRSPPGPRSDVRATSPPVQDSAVTSESPRCRRRVEHELLDRARVLREQRRRLRSASSIAPPAPRPPRRRRARPGSRRRARRSSPEPRRARRRPLRAPWPRPTRSGRRSAGSGARRGDRASSIRFTGPPASAAAQRRRSSGGGPGQDDGHASPCSTTRPGAVPATRARALLPEPWPAS